MHGLNLSPRGSARNISRLARVAAVMGVLALGLSGCTSVVGANSSVPIQSLRIPIKGAALRSFYSQAVRWEPCGGGMKCASISAPLDWEQPSGKSIDLAMIMHPASGTRIGSLLVNPGGPGASGIELVGSGVDNAVDASVAAHYDVVGFDPRGVGYSSAVKCGGAAGVDKFLYGTVKGAIGSDQWISGEEAKSKAFAARCKQDSGALLAHVDTVSAARDLDLMRAVLGEKKLDYLGYSYGTYLGTVYAGLFPKNVGRLVFDGPDDPWAGSGSENSDNDSQAKGFDDDLKAYLRGCLSGAKQATGGESCPFSGSLKDALASVSHSLASATTHPIAGSDGRELNAATLATGISDAMYTTSSWPSLTRAFTELHKGDVRGAFALADDYNDREKDGKYYDNLNEASLAIGCLEDGPSVDLSYDASELMQLRRTAPVLGPYEAYSDLECSGWPYGPTPFPDPIHATGAPPILLVGTTGDPATPYSGAQALTNQLTGSVLLTYQGEGHTAYDEGHACVDAAVDASLIHGTLPKTSTRC